jgi:hypothetical protein
MVATSPSGKCFKGDYRHEQRNALSLLPVICTGDRDESTREMG